LRAYLWGIERLADTRTERPGRTVESLPMRNWKVFYSHHKPELLHSWEPTYEELKGYLFYLLLFDYHMLRAYLWGIESYYTHHLLHSEFLLRAYLWGIESKKNLLYLNAIRSVESLPMRNWKEFKQYCIQSFIFVESLPMRNWKSGGSVTITIKCEAGWEPTYEELKERRKLLSDWIQRVESLPMRNWKQNSKSSSKPANRVESLPMRNWKIETSLKSLKETSRWEPTYEELKAECLRL